MITKRQELILLFFISRALFLGFGFSQTINITKQDTWISCILGLFIGLLLVTIISDVQKRKKTTPLQDILKNMGYFGIIIRCFILIFSFLLMLISLIIITTYTSNLYLLETPALFIITPIIFLIYLICQKGIHILGRISECLFPISMLFLFISFTSLIPMIKIDSFTPILETKALPIIWNALQISLISATPTLLLTQVPTDGSKYYRSFIFAFLSIALLIICTIGIIGPTLSSFYQFPEYMVLKKIAIFNFLEKIENLISITWLIDFFILASLSGLLTKSMLPAKINTIFLNAVFIALLFSTIYITSNNDIYTTINNILPISLAALFLIIAITIIVYLIIKNRKNHLTEQLGDKKRQNIIFS